MMYATLPILVSILAATPGTRFVNANVFDSEATSFVVADGVMHADPYDGPIRREVDLQGGFVVPRLVDAHAHVLGLGKALERVDLNGARSWREAVALAPRRRRRAGSSAAAGTRTTGRTRASRPTRR